MYVALGIVFLLIGAMMVWLVTGGSEWNSTHTRLGGKISHVGQHQEQTNKLVGSLGAAGLIVAGVALIVANVGL